MPDVLRREERLERPGAGLVVHACSGVRYLDADEGVAVQLHVARRDRQAAAGRHRVATVEHDIENDLRELVGIGIDRSERLRQGCPQLDIGSERSCEQRLEPANDLVHVEPLREQHLLAAEGEQLPRQRSGVSCGFPDLIHVVGAHIVLVEGVREQLRVARDRREHVVEVVCDSTGELADRLHLL